VQQSGEVLSISVLGKGADGFPLDVRVHGFGGDAPRLRAAFASQVIDVTLPDDLPALEAAQAAARAALADAGAAAHIPAFDAHCAAERARLATRWAELDAKGRSPDTLRLVGSPAYLRPALAYGRTALSSDPRFYDRGDVWGIVLARGGECEGISSSSEVSPVTQDALATIAHLSGHEKLELLAGGPSVLPKLRAEFRRRRINGLSAPLCAIDLDGAVMLGGQVFYRDGRYGSFSAYVNQHGPYMRGGLGGPGAYVGIRIERDRGGKLTIERPVSTDPSFKTKQDLDRWLRGLLEMLVAMAPAVPPECLAGLDYTPFHPAHPLLSGLTVPLDQQPLVAALLGAPYAEAVALAEKTTARRAKKAAKAETATGLDAQIADGAMFGRLKLPQSGDLGGFSNHRTTIFITRSGTTPAGRRRRELAGIFPHDAPGVLRLRTMSVRPLTAMHMARHPRLTNPDALSHASDACLRWDQRDVFEAAFRLSFHLDGEARNPFLDTDPAIWKLPAGEGSLVLRLTSIDTDDGPRVRAFGVTDPASDLYSLHVTGAGFMALWVGDMWHFAARPALTEAGRVAPLTHRRLIADAIARHAADDTATLSAGFDTAWAKLEKKHKVVP
jgi:hypothetical protein